MEQITEISYALDTFYFLVSGALVMWMAAGFAMLEAGLVRGKNTAEILVGWLQLNVSRHTNKQLHSWVRFLLRQR